MAFVRGGKEEGEEELEISSFSHRKPGFSSEIEEGNETKRNEDANERERTTVESKGGKNHPAELAPFLSLPFHFFLPPEVERVE